MGGEAESFMKSLGLDVDGAAAFADDALIATGRGLRSLKYFLLGEFMREGGALDLNYEVPKDPSLTDQAKLMLDRFQDGIVVSLGRRQQVYDPSLRVQRPRWRQWLPRAILQCGLPPPGCSRGVEAVRAIAAH